MQSLANSIPPETPRKITRLHLCFLALLILVSLAIRPAIIYIPFKSGSVDEKIALGVVSGMLHKRTLDTNWLQYEVGQFKYPSYNFSSYHIALAALFEPYFAATGQSPGLRALQVVSALLGVAT